MAENKPPIVWSSDAQGDLSDIWDYYLRVAGPRTAEKIVREIATAADLIQRHPFSGRARDEIRPDLRSLAIRPNVIFYRVRNDTAEIVRILDGRRDIERIFTENQEEEP
jgi:toxin ParE1/3/4